MVMGDSFVGTKQARGSLIHAIHKRLYDGVADGIQVVVQGEGAVAVAIVGVVTSRDNDSFGPADVLEVNVELVATAVLPMSVIIVVVFVVFAAGSALLPRVSSVAPPVLLLTLAIGLASVKHFVPGFCC